MGPGSHRLSIKRRLCPLQTGLGTDKAVLLLFTRLPVEENNCSFSRFCSNGRTWSDFRGCCCLQSSLRGCGNSEGPLLGLLVERQDSAQEGSLEEGRTGPDRRGKRNQLPKSWHQISTGVEFIGISEMTPAFKGRENGILEERIWVGCT